MNPKRGQNVKPAFGVETQTGLDTSAVKHVGSETLVQKVLDLSVQRDDNQFMGISANRSLEFYLTFLVRLCFKSVQSKMKHIDFNWSYRTPTQREMGQEMIKMSYSEYVPNTCLKIKSH